LNIGADDGKQSGRRSVDRQNLMALDKRVHFSPAYRHRANGDPADFPIKSAASIAILRYNTK
jgi:hypothetical protein